MSNRSAVDQPSRGADRNRSPADQADPAADDILVLVTRNERNEFTEPIATVADNHSECEQTQMCPRVVGEDFETPVYPVDDGAHYQTTFAYSRQLLAVRVAQVESYGGLFPLWNPAHRWRGRRRGL